MTPSDADHPLEPLNSPPEGLPDDAHWIVVRKGHVALRAESITLPFGSEPPAVAHVDRHFIGMIGGHGVWAIDAEDHLEHHEITDVTGDHEFVHLRGVYPRVPESQWFAAGRAEQIVQWARTHRYCGRCGTETEAHASDRARHCPACGLVAYPRLAPAIIVLVERTDGAALLAWGAQFPGRFYSTLAGFVEPGENLESAVAREVFEETGITVHDVQYMGSQPWPFPHSLMIGFRAMTHGGELVLQEEEIVDAGWYFPDDLPPVPRGGMSIAGRLIDDWIERTSR